MVRANGWTLPKVSTMNLRYMIYVQTNVQVFPQIYLITLFALLKNHVYIKYVKY